MRNTKSAILVGIGGQGAILISKIMTNGLIQAGYDVKQSEVHGMAQRGGSVSTQVRWGDRVYGPVFGKGEADLLVAFEKMEAVRYADFLKPEGLAVINNYAQDSTTTAAGLEAAVRAGWKASAPAGALFGGKDWFCAAAGFRRRVKNRLPKRRAVQTFGSG